MQDMKIRLSQWLSRQRIAKSLTLEELGRRVGSGKGYMCGIMAEKVNPPSRKVCTKMAKLFHESPQYVIFMAYRDKAPEPVQERFTELEALREATEEYRQLTSAVVLPTQQVDDHQKKLRDAWERVNLSLLRLKTMWDPPLS